MKILSVFDISVISVRGDILLPDKSTSSAEISVRISVRLLAEYKTISSELAFVFPKVVTLIGLVKPITVSIPYLKPS